jgi:hypothetical protein
MIEFSGLPIVNVISGANGREVTATMRIESDNIDYWGKSRDVKKVLFND